ncbi:acyl-CoA thioesterase [Flexivirga caeni]|uniref:Acyl-CoA thioesterase n=1 Tax=Flexivirga caeni TaxID=2294115 RepID=A0A3M9M725_9MICO|nr:thioesterase family protein [Flexivirga caeni]RNI21341.1 acyl-CoA thioesterase [Flexivirga caeni]
MPARLYYVDVPMRWSDMDALGHVNNVQYLRLLEEARILGFAEWFAGVETGPDGRPPLLIARAEIDYVRQLHWRAEPLVVALWVSDLGAASFDTSYEVRASRDPDAEVYAVAETSQVVFDMATQRPIRLAPEHRAVLERYVAEPIRMRRRPKGHR